MTLFQSGIDILYHLMTVDRDIAESEMVEIIQYFLKGETGLLTDDRKAYPFGETDFSGMLLEMNLLGALSDEELKARVDRSVELFRDQASPDQKKRMLDFARKMIESDGQIRDEEVKALREIEEKWGMA